MACQVEHNFPIGRNGIVVNTVGPWEIDGDVWQFDYVPVLTDECDLCAERVAKGQGPTCVKHCMADVMRYGDVEQLLANMKDAPKQVIYVK
jgi:anaerobic dimethyl sulfoxide reductase subunit B (iron-sulfur subunit)